MIAEGDENLTIDDSVDQGAPGTQFYAPILTVSFPPHTRSAETVRRIMLITCAALLPAVGFAVALYGLRAIASVLAAVAAATATEWLITTLRDRRRAAIDGSACLTGLLLALSLPPQLPLWAAPLASVFAIGIVKIAFGGLGRNFLNPALAGRAFCAFTFPALFASAALAAPRMGQGAGSLDMIANLFVGYSGGWLGASSTAALLIGAIALWILRLVDFAIPLAFLGSAFLLSWATSGQGAVFTPAGPLSALAAILTGGIPLVALFMATDPVTSPSAKRSRVLFGAGCGVLTFAFRKFGNANDGAMHAVLFMNLTVPYFDRYVRQTPFGGRRRTRMQQPGSKAWAEIAPQEPEAAAQAEPEPITAPVEEL